MSKLIRYLALSLAFAFAARAAAEGTDLLIFRNGDHLTGTLVKRDNGKVYFHSDALGDIVAADNLVTVIQNLAAETVSPETLAGLPPQPPVKPLQPPPPKSAPQEPVATVRHTNGKPAVVKAMAPPWKGKIEAGYSNEMTNVRTIQTTVRAEADRTVGPDEYLFQAHYIYARSDGQVSTDQDEGEFQWRHHLDERLFAQSLTNYNSDKVRGLHDDADETLGLGYKLFQSLRQTVDAGVGVTEQYLDLAGVQKGADTLGNLFQDYTYKINGRFTFLEDASLEISPQSRGSFGLTNGQSTEAGKTANYSYKFDSTLEGKLSERLSLNLHYEYQYYSDILAPNARGDQQITTTLGYAF
jgi:putative salt-induced outer membrane protein YdiY